MLFIIPSTLLVKKSAYGYFFTIDLLLAPKIVGAIDYLYGLYNKSEMLYFFFTWHYDSPPAPTKTTKVEFHTSSYIICIVFYVVFHILLALHSFTSTKPMQKGLLTSLTLRLICSHFSLLTSNLISTMF